VQLHASLAWQYNYLYNKTLTWNFSPLNVAQALESNLRYISAKRCSFSRDSICRLMNLRMSWISDRDLDSSSRSLTFVSAKIIDRNNSHGIIQERTMLREQDKQLRTFARLIDESKDTCILRYLSTVQHINTAG